MKKALLIVTTSAIAVLSQSTFAMAPQRSSQSGSYNSGSFQVQDSGPSADAVEAILNEQGKQLEQIEALIRANSYGQALTLAKQSLDLIKLKTGVDPKVRLIDPIVVTGVLSASDITHSYNDLSYTVKNQVAQIVSHYKGWLVFGSPQPRKANLRALCYGRIHAH